MNDGLALPLVILMLAVVVAERVRRRPDAARPRARRRGRGRRAVGRDHAREEPPLLGDAAYQPLNGLAIGLLVLSLTSLMHANEFLGAFAAGVTVATAGPAIREAFRTLGWTLSEVLKLAGVLVLGALLSPRFLAQIPLSRIRLRAPRPARRPSVRARARPPRQRPRLARACGRRVVRAEGVRVRPVRAADPPEPRRAGRAALSPRRDRRRRVHHRALVVRRAGRTLVPAPRGAQPRSDGLTPVARARTHGGPATGAGACRPPSRGRKKPRLPCDSAVACYRVSDAALAPAEPAASRRITERESHMSSGIDRDDDCVSAGDVRPVAGRRSRPQP